MKSMYCLLFVYSIDDLDKIELENHSVFDIQTYIEETKMDFNYNDFSIAEISIKKIPYVNCNRKVFCNSDVDLIDIFKSKNINLTKEISERRYEVDAKLYFIKNAIDMLVSDNLNFEMIKGLSQKYFYKSCINPILAEKLCCKLERLAECIIISHLDKVKSSTYDFLLESENHLNEDSYIDLFKLFFGLRLSELFNSVFANKNINVERVKQFIDEIYYIYDRVFCYIDYMASPCSIALLYSDKFYQSYFLKEYILLKWMIEFERISLFRPAMEFKKFNHMMIYSINADKTLIEMLTILVQKILDINLTEDIKFLGLTHVKIPNSNEPNYEFNFSNEKSYVIRMYNLETYNKGCIPPGLFTACLNCKNGFESLGFMGIVRETKDTFKYYFLAIEEKPSLYILTSDLNIFKSNVIQVFYFLLYYLEMINSLNVYRMNVSQLNLGFAVYCSDDMKWKFILDFIENFDFYKNEDVLSKNHEHIIDKFLNLFVNQPLANFLKKLKVCACKLENSKDKYCLLILSDMVKNKLQDFNTDGKLKNLKGKKETHCVTQ